jgi:uncharacterized glyoxalase superfamily protein PhnB
MQLLQRLLRMRLQAQRGLTSATTDKRPLAGNRTGEPHRSRRSLGLVAPLHRRQAPLIRTVFKKIMPVLRVADLTRSLEWYTCQMGFELCWRSPNDGGGENCMLQTDDVRIMLSTGSHLGDKPQFSGTLYFETTGVRDFYDRIKDDVEIVWPLEAMDYGTLEFGIRDPDGYTLAFAEQAEE